MVGFHCRLFVDYPKSDDQSICFETRWDRYRLVVVFNSKPQTLERLTSDKQNEIITSVNSLLSPQTWQVPKKERSQSGFAFNLVEPA